MPRPDQSGWAVKYEDPRSSVRILVGMPPGMLKDIQTLASQEGVSVSEFVRRALSEQLAVQLTSHPYKQRVLTARVVS